MTDEEVIKRWREDIVLHAAELDEDSDKGGHDWHSLWAGFVVALGRRDIADWSSYMKLGFPVEIEAS